MTLPKIGHLLSIEDVLRRSFPCWCGLSALPWSLRTGREVNADAVRAPNREPGRYPAYPDGLPGLPYGWRTAKEAIDWRDAAIEKLERSKRRVAH